MRRIQSGGGDFTDRVMAGIARESAPTPARTFLLAIRQRSPRDASATLWVAWHLGTVRSWHVGPGVRARSIALVLAVTCALGTGSLVAAAALRVAAEPALQLFGSGVDEQRPVENGPTRVDRPRAVEDDQSGADQSGDGESGDGESGEDENAADDQSGPDQPGEEPRGEDADDDQSGADEPGGDDEAESDDSGDDEPGGIDSDEDARSGG